MSRFRFFDDSTGSAVELTRLTFMDNGPFSVRFPGVKGIRSDGLSMRVGHDENGWLRPVTRQIEMKAFPSRHECNAKCMNGSLRGTCECKCGGKNHGRGMFTRLMESRA